MKTTSYTRHVRFELPRAVSCLLSGFLLLSLTPAADARADEFGHAIVTTGAFLIDDHGKRNGYLPVGTIVGIVGQDVTVRNRRTGQRETYSRVRSQSGLAGFLRTDLRIRIDQNPLAVPIDTRVRIPLYREAFDRTPNVDCEERRIRIHFLDLYNEQGAIPLPHRSRRLDTDKCVLFPK